MKKRIKSMLRVFLWIAAIIVILICICFGYHRYRLRKEEKLAYEQQVINLVSMFGKDFVIDQTANDRIVFVKLKEPVKGSAR